MATSRQVITSMPILVDQSGNVVRNLGYPPDPGEMANAQQEASQIGGRIVKQKGYEEGGSIFSIGGMSDELESWPDETLVGEYQNQTKGVPQYLIISELVRRKELREGAKAKGTGPQQTVADEVIASMGGGLGGIPQMAQPQMPPPQMPPQGGVRGFEEGGVTSPGVLNPDISFPEMRNTFLPWSYWSPEERTYYSPKGSVPGSTPEIPYYLQRYATDSEWDWLTSPDTGSEGDKDELWNRLNASLITERQSSPFSSGSRERLRALHEEDIKQLGYELPPEAPRGERLGRWREQGIFHGPRRLPDTPEIRRNEEDRINKENAAREAAERQTFEDELALSKASTADDDKTSYESLIKSAMDVNYGTEEYIELLKELEGNKRSARGMGLVQFGAALASDPGDFMGALARAASKGAESYNRIKGENIDDRVKYLQLSVGAQQLEAKRLIDLATIAASVSAADAKNRYTTNLRDTTYWRQQKDKIRGEILKRRDELTRTGPGSVLPEKAHLHPELRTFYTKNEETGEWEWDKDKVTKIVHDRANRDVSEKMGLSMDSL